jgi:hypothetical protein
VLDGEFLKGERTVKAGTGEFVFVPRGVVHNFTNVGQEPARCLGIVTPGGLHEKLLSSLGESAKAETLPPPPEAPPDAEKFAAIMRKYDTELLPPSGRLGSAGKERSFSNRGSRGFRSGSLACVLVSRA